MNRIQERFRDRTSQDAVVLAPYFTAGFPDCETAAELIRRADGFGVPVVELGFPYSDSIADGPVIQSSFYQTLDHGHRVADTFDLAARVRPSVQCGLVAMVSYSIVHRTGLQRFVAEAAGAGFDGLILPDVPIEESAAAAQAADRVGLCYVGLVAPTTSAQRRERIARSSSGFIYQIAVAGTTGERSDLPPELPRQVGELKRLSGLPVCVGFGISRPEHARAVCDVADGAIIGSAIVRRIADAVDRGASPSAIVESVAQFLAQLAGRAPRAGEGL